MVELFSKIPNDMWSDEGKKFQAMGGKDGFLIYMYLTSTRARNDIIKVSVNGLMDELALCVNRHRHKIRILEGLGRLIEEGYIIVDDINKGNNTMMEITWVDLFKDGQFGWVKFQASDFDLYPRIGGLPYMVMWMLRMYRNHKTGTSFLSVTEISDNLGGVSRNYIQGATNLFRETGLFDVEVGEYYYNRDLGKKIRKRNEYRYIGNKEQILAMDKKEIEMLLNKS